MASRLVSFSAAAAVLFLGSAAHAADYSSASSYNSGYGMSAGGENKASDFSLRDDQGNMTIINGMFASSNFQQESGTQNASSQSGAGGSGTRGAGSITGGASAIGNSLNVVTYGNFNTVIVDSRQINNGNQTASVVLNSGQ